MCNPDYAPPTLCEIASLSGEDLNYYPEGTGKSSGRPMTADWDTDLTLPLPWGP